MPVDGLALLSARPSAGTVMTKTYTALTTLNVLVIFHDTILADLNYTIWLEKYIGNHY